MLSFIEQGSSLESSLHLVGDVSLMSFRLEQSLLDFQDLNSYEDYRTI